jgi:hypothetical protein
VNQIVFSWFIAMAAVMIFPPLANAQLFGRRGCSTGHCFVPQVHHAPAVVESPDFVQTFVFNNIAPPGDLSARGDTLYGVARALEYNSPNSALYLDNAKRALEVSSEFTSAARGVDSEILQAATIDAQGRAVEAAFRALKPDVTATARSTTTTIRLRNGSCLKCHAPDGSAAERFVIDDTYDLAKHMKAEAAIESGAMPPKSNLSPAEKATIRLQLGKLVPNP